MKSLRISNRTARHLWLHTNGLSATPTGVVDVMGMIRALGFVQIDTIRNVTRAHHHILWSRNQNYREKMLWPRLQKDRAIFEHFTHDASLIDMAIFPLWSRQFKRLGDQARNGAWFASGLADETIAAIRARIANEGALSTHAFDTKIEGPREMWARPPHKKALDQMWYAGDLATCYRENFVKFYNLPERVFPHPATQSGVSESDQINQLNHIALDKLSFGTSGDIQRFWQTMSAKEAKVWADSQSDLIPVEIETAERNWHAVLAPADIEVRLAGLPEPTSRLRILNPFDPAIRDRNRLKRLFGFEYVNEMFVPAAQRRWGYYVYPLLEKDRFVGRIEVKADRAKNWMQITGFWPEAKVKWPRARLEKLEAELVRFARLAGISQIKWSDSAQNQRAAH